jgi:cell division protein FtsW
MLLVIGMVMVYSASMAIAEAGRQTGNQSTYFLVRHAVFLIIALVAAGIAFQVPCRPGSAGRRGCSSPASCCWRWC